MNLQSVCCIDADVEEKRC